MINPERLSKIEKLVARRQGNITVILENVHDVHNVGAVLRSCDAVGLIEVYLLLTNVDKEDTVFTLGKRTSMGARKWVDVHYYQDVVACFNVVRQKYSTILAAAIDEGSTNLFANDLAGSVALLFGNESSGLSDEAIDMADGRFYIPQMGMVQSLNISVACAVTLYEAMRQRENAGLYTDNTTMTPLEKQSLLERYIQRSEDRDRRRETHLIK